MKPPLFANEAPLAKNLPRCFSRDPAPDISNKALCIETANEAPRSRMKLPCLQQRPPFRNRQ